MGSRTVAELSWWPRLGTQVMLNLQVIWTMPSGATQTPQQSGRFMVRGAVCGGYTAVAGVGTRADEKRGPHLALSLSPHCPARCAAQGDTMAPPGILWNPHLTGRWLWYDHVPGAAGSPGGPRLGNKRGRGSRSKALLSC